MRSPARGVTLGLALLVAGCSTIAEDPPPECEVDQDCGENLICSIAQGNICVPEVQPPLANLGFDIREDEFRIELHGCDPEVNLEPGGNELRVRSRKNLARDFEFSVSSIKDVETCDACGVGFTCDAEDLTCKGPIDAQLDLQQNSRLGLDSLKVDAKQYTIPIDPPLPDGELPAPVPFVWPQYDSDDPKAHWATQIDVTPSDMAPLRRVIADTVEGPFDLVSTHRCQRGLFGGEGEVRLFSDVPVPVGDATVEFFHDEPIAAPSTVIGPTRTCSDETPCPLGWSCNSLGTCGLDLTGVSIGKASTSNDPMGGFHGGFVPVPIYTYCETIASTPEDPLSLELFVRVTPLPETGLPTVVYRIDQTFLDPPSPDASHSVSMDGVLCLPPWQPPHTIGFSVVGEPVELASNDLGVYRCCSTDCLPTQGPDVEPIPPPNSDTCSGFERIQFDTLWFLEPEGVTAWGIACEGTVPSTNSAGANGRYSREVEPGGCGDTPCATVDLTHGQDGEVGRLYDVGIVQPQGSVFRSRRLQVTVDADTLEFSPFELEPRVLLRGSVTCAADTEANCNFANAVVAVERLRVDTDESNPIGPFFFQGTSDAEGNFVLPVEPGVYVITSYPAIGQPGGPSPLQILDLRSESTMVETTAEGVPTATLEQPLELDEGVLVRALLKDFDSNTSITPLDVGSWTSDPAFEGFDLNAPETCHNSDPTAGCQIRRLRPNNASISLLLSKQFQFTARTGASDPCPAANP
jgi:hypothetical protein